MPEFVGKSKMVTMAMKDGGQTGIGITVAYSSGLEHGNKLQDCSRAALVIQVESMDSARRDPTFSSKVPHKHHVQTRI